LDDSVTIQGLEKKVKSLEKSKDLKKRDSASILYTLKQISAQIDNDKINNKGCTNLDNFKKQIQIFIKAKKLDKTEGLALLQYTHVIKQNFC